MPKSHCLLIEKTSIESNSLSIERVPMHASPQEIVSIALSIILLTSTIYFEKKKKTFYAVLGFLAC